MDDQKELSPYGSSFHNVRRSIVTRSIEPKLTYLVGEKEINMSRKKKMDWYMKDIFKNN
jgi:hypothetical protein